MGKKQVTRYNPELGRPDVTPYAMMMENERGRYISYSDYQILEAELKVAKKIPTKEEVETWMEGDAHEHKTALSLAEAASWNFNLWTEDGSLRESMVDIALKYVKEVG